MEGRALSDLKLCGCAHPSETGPEEHGLVRTTGTETELYRRHNSELVGPVTTLSWLDRLQTTTRIGESVKRNISLR